MNDYTLHLGDCLEIMPTLEAGSVDAIIADVPYGILLGHKIESGLEPGLFTELSYNLLKDKGFYSFFGMFPTLIIWSEIAMEHFNYKDHIVWCKRNPSHGGSLELRRMHENIMIFSKGLANYFIIDGFYDDILRPRMEEGLASIESLFRELSFWRGKAQGKDLVSIPDDKGNANDDYFQRNGRIKTNKPKLGRIKTGFSTIWSFYPENKKHRNGRNGQIKHPNVKPIDLVIRLIELLTDEGMTILDPCFGSCTTGEACLRTGRRFIGIEKDAGYYQIGVDRLERVAKELRGDLDHLPMFAEAAA